jgi:hypothetical protein
MAIIAGEGFATEACRVLFANAEKGDYQLIVVHDTDPYGYNIARTLGEETRRMPGYNVDVIDLGLTVEDALRLELTPEWAERKKALPSGLKFTELEEEYFIGEPIGKNKWKYKRSELSSFTAPGLVDYVVSGVEVPRDGRGWKGKVIPPATELPGLTQDMRKSILDDAIRSELFRILSIENIIESAANSWQGLISLEDAVTWIKDAFDADPTVAWDAALEQKIHLLLEEKKRDLEDAVRAACKQTL